MIIVKLTMSLSLFFIKSFWDTILRNFAASLFCRGAYGPILRPDKLAHNVRCASIHKTPCLHQLDLLSIHL